MTSNLEEIDSGKVRSFEVLSRKFYKELVTHGNTILWNTGHFDRDGTIKIIAQTIKHGSTEEFLEMIMDLQATPKDNLEFWVDTQPHFKFADCIYDSIHHGFLMVKGEPLYSGLYDIKDGPDSLMKQMEAMSVNDDKMLKEGIAQETAEIVLSYNDNMDETGKGGGEADDLQGKAEEGSKPERKEKERKKIVTKMTG